MSVEKSREQKPTVREVFTSAVLALSEPRTIAEVRRAIGVGRMTTLRGYAKDLVDEGLAVIDDQRRIAPIREQESHDMAGSTSELDPGVKQLVKELVAAELKNVRQPEAAQPATVQAPAQHGLCQDKGCGTCTQAEVGVRQSVLHDLAHVAAWAGLDAEIAALDEAAKRWNAAGRPKEGYESVADGVMAGARG